MSKLDKLIAELCPNGVEYKKLGDVCDISAGGDVPKNLISKEKTNKFYIPIISNGIGDNALYGFTNIAKVIKPAVTISARGTIGYAEYRDYQYYPIIRLLSVIPNNLYALNTRFLYFCLQGKSYNIPMSGIPQLTAPELKKVIIPIPPLPVQEEIVRILDSFTQLTAELQDKLQAELKARKKQYKYYFDKIINLYNSPMVKLENIGQVKMCKRILKSQTFKHGDIPFYKIGTFGKIPDAYISQELFNIMW